jgi:hypothetical protein
VGRRSANRRRPGAAVLFAVILWGLSPTAFAENKDAAMWTRSRGTITAEFGIDSLQRKFYRPRFDFSWPLAVIGGGRAWLEIDFLQRINGKLGGEIDYWVKAGTEKRIDDGISFDASLNHFCRHLTSTANPYVLNLNEVVGRVWVRADGVELGAGFGPFIGGSPGYDRLMVFDFNLPRFLLPELSFESEWKWVDFEAIYYDAGLSVGLSPSMDVFIRAARHYGFAPTAYLGIRFRPEGVDNDYVDGFDTAIGIYPFYNAHKLLATGAYRLNFIREGDRRFLLDVDFQTPLLSGDGFFAQFWPDRILHAVSAEYEKPLPGGLFVSWYARYFVDMPVDKEVRFRSSLSTGLLLRNQADFDRLDEAVRFEIAAGYDFAFAYDVRIKLGAGGRVGKTTTIGAEFRLEANGERRTAEGRAFASFGRDIGIRPFIGVRQISYIAGGPPPPDSFRNKLTFGVGFYKWF